MNRIFSMEWLRQMRILVMIYQNHLFEWFASSHLFQYFSIGYSLSLRAYSSFLRFSVALFYLFIYFCSFSISNDSTIERIKKTYAFGKIPAHKQFSSTSNIWLMPIWNGNPHSTKPNPNRMNVCAFFSLYGKIHSE